MVQSDQSSHPSISVIIATFNRAPMLKRCLLQLASQDLHHSCYEVIVVNDGSTDDTGVLLAGIDVPYSLRVIAQENAGQAKALNEGVKLARSPFCLFLDDDIIPESSLIAEHIRAQTAAKGAIVMGRLGIRLVRGGDGMARAIAEWWDSHYARLEREGCPATAVDCHGANLSVPVTAFLDVGGFALDVPRGYDAELVYRLTKLGYRMIYAHRAAGIQEYGKGWREASEDFEHEGAGGLVIYKRHPELLPELTLGQFRVSSRAAYLLRRALLFLRVPTNALAYITAHLPDGRLSFRLRSFVCSYAYWRGARKVLSDAGDWQRLTATDRSRQSGDA
jgi:glycosyltransferase involved in cell wall biosynthesis